MTQSNKDRDALVEELVSNPIFLHYCRGKLQPGEWQAYKVFGDISFHPDVVQGDCYPYISDSLHIKDRIEEYMLFERKATQRERGISKQEESLNSEQERLEKKWIKTKRTNGRISEISDQLVELRREVDEIYAERTNLRKKVNVLFPFEEVWPEFRDEPPNFMAKVDGYCVGSSHVFAMHYLDNTHDSRPDTHVSYALLIPEIGGAERMVPEVSQDPSLLIETFRKTYTGLDNSKGKLRIIETNFDLSR